MTDTRSFLPGPGWHASASSLARFAADPAGLDDASASSIESHLVACAACRSQLATVSPLDVTASWEAVADRVDRPRMPLVERLLERIGVGSGLARLVGATPGLWLAGLAAVTILAVAAVVVSNTADAVGPFLVLAPLVALAAVAASFAPAADPAGETGVATPLHGVGLALRRAAVVVTTTFAVLGVAALGVPGLGIESAAWVLPAVALVVGSLALGTWWRIEVCASALAVAWVAITSSLRLTQGRHLALVDTALFSTTSQMAALAAALVAGLVLAARSDCYATLEART